MTGPNYVGIYSFYDSPAADAQHLHWVRSAIEDIQPFAVGSYMSEVDLSGDAAIVRKCYSTDTWQRLLILKVKYGPGNLFFGYS